MLARDAGDRPLLRRALTVQGAILCSTNNPGDALTALSEALEIAEEIDDEIGKVAVWINIGTAFYEAALYADARDCAERATRLATGTPVARSLKAVALGNVALYCMHMQEYETGLNCIRDAIGLSLLPEKPLDLLATSFRGRDLRALVAGRRESR